MLNTIYVVIGRDIHILIFNHDHILRKIPIRNKKKKNIEPS